MVPEAFEEGKTREQGQKKIKGLLAVLGFLSIGFKSLVVLGLSGLGPQKCRALRKIVGDCQVS